MEIELRVRKLKNGKAAGKDEVTVGWWTGFWSLCNIAFENGVVLED